MEVKRGRQDLPASVGVVGGGRMGSGIAHAFVVAGSTVTVVERDAAGMRAAVARLDRSLGQAGKRSDVVQFVAEAKDRLTVSDDFTRLATCDLVIEAVPEDIVLKTEILQRMSSVAPQADLATNTSSLSIDLMASRLPTAARLVGLHFFNPVPVSTLVEVVQGSATPPDLVNSAIAWVSALGKTSIVVQDVPGFATTRLGVVLAMEAIRMLEDGVASAHDLDAAMTLGYRHPMGPLRTTDIVGLDVRLAIARHLTAELGDRFAPPELLVNMVDAGLTGRKSGRGFFSW